MKDSQLLWPRMGSLTFVLLIISLWSNSSSVFGEDGSKPTDIAKKAPQTEPVGCYLAPGMVTLLEDEIKAGLKRREIESRFAQFTSYAATTLDNTANGRSSSELSGNCRLTWYDKLYRNPLKATAETEEFTRKFHKAVLAGHTGLGRVLDMSSL